MEITIDEWIVHFISDPQKREWTLTFLEKVFQKCDRLVTIRGAPLMKKIWRMSKESGNWDPTGRSFAKYFFINFISNSNKFRLLDESELKPLPVELERETPHDDLYLVKAAMNTADRLILTTDSRLKEKLSHMREPTIHLVDEFPYNQHPSTNR